MELFYAMLVPFLMLAVALWGTVRRVDLWGALVSGAGEGLKVTVGIVPPLVALLSAVYMLRASGRWNCWVKRWTPAGPPWASRWRPSACCWCVQ